MNGLWSDICKNKNLFTNFIGSIIWSLIFLIPVLCLSLLLKNKNTALATNLLNELQTPTILEVFVPIYILVSCGIFYFAINKQNSSIFELKDFWFYKYQVNKFFLFENITLFFMLLSTDISKSIINSELYFSWSIALSILGNYILVGFFPLTFSGQTKQFQTWRKILVGIFVLSQVFALATGLGILSNLIHIL